jgi:hypothetical protein
VTLDNLQVYLDGKAIDNWNQVVTALSEAYANKDVTASFHWNNQLTLRSNARFKVFYLKPSVIQRDKVDISRSLLTNRLFIITRACSVYGDCSYTCYLPDKDVNSDCLSYIKSLSATKPS